MNRILMFLLILLGLFFTSGCASGHYYTSEQSLQVASAFRFPDLPVPKGFKFIPNSSFIYESSEIRVGKMKYQGAAWPDSIVRFYKEYMTSNNWRILNIIEGEETLLSFNNDQEICIIKFECSYGRGSLVISVSPLFQNNLGEAKFTYNRKNNNYTRQD